MSTPSPVPLARVLGPWVGASCMVFALLCADRASAQGPSGGREAEWHAYLSPENELATVTFHPIVGAEIGFLTATPDRGKLHLGEPGQSPRYLELPGATGLRAGLRGGLRIDIGAHHSLTAAARIGWHPGDLEHCQIWQSEEAYCYAGIEYMLDASIEVMHRVWLRTPLTDFFVAAGAEAGAYLYAAKADWDQYVENEAGPGYRFDAALSDSVAQLAPRLGGVMVLGAAFDASRRWTVGLRVSAGGVGPGEWPFADIGVVAELAP